MNGVFRRLILYSKQYLIVMWHRSSYICVSPRVRCWSLHSSLVGYGWTLVFSSFDTEASYDLLSIYVCLFAAAHLFQDLPDPISV